MPQAGSPFAVGGTVSGLSGSGLVLQNNSTESLNVTADGAFVFATGRRGGERYEVGVAQQPTTVPRQTCEVANGSGTIGSEAVRNIAVTCRDMTGRFLYAAIEGARSVQGFSIDRTTGALAEIPGSSVVLGGPAPRFLATSPDQRFLHVIGDQLFAAPRAQVQVLRIDSESGILTTAPNGTESFPANLRFGPVFLASGRAVYFGVGDNQGRTGIDNRVYGFAIDPTSGSLSALPGSPYALPGDSVPLFARLSASDNRLYVGYSPYQGGAASSAGLAVFSVDSGDGRLAQRSDISLSYVPNSIALHSSGRYLYVGGFGELTTFAVDATSGDLTLRAARPTWEEEPTLGFTSLDFSSSGDRAYVWSRRPISGGDVWINSISVVDIDPGSGILNEVPGSRVVPSGQWSVSKLAVQPRGRFLIGSRFPTGLFPTAEQVWQLWNVWTIDPQTGRLSAAVGSPQLMGRGAELVPDFRIDPSGRFLYSADYVRQVIASYQLDDSTGAVTAVSNTPTGVLPRGLEIVGLQ